jgi:hypothetical protein
LVLEEQLDLVIIKEALLEQIVLWLYLQELLQ